ncbi:hypothetical protein B7R22_10955 [Subtercola boreus]|uniref:Uncharacterized protein n=1 Tax=Subtercola boreus TaxID=120213 RepID=A0A3E0VVP3_9MICO|nr:hypothetical protein [Subtercola boreus]RFA14122.1 hypothetical protein B7R22_10955 [Subtercola boreus]
MPRPPPRSAPTSSPPPGYHFSGPALSQTGGHGDPRPGDLDLRFHGGHMNEIVDGVDALRVAVRRRFHSGATPSR